MVRVLDGLIYVIMQKSLEHNNQQKIEISLDRGFLLVSTESVSSKVFVKDRRIFKLNSRNSVERARADLNILKSKLQGFEDHLPVTEVTKAVLEDVEYTCISQSLVEGEEIKKLDQERLLEVLKLNRDFLIKLLEYFFEAIEARELYPDIVGYPADPEYYNAINLIVEKFTSKLILCDVGLSPHEDTLVKHGLDFYDGDNVKIYVEKMSKFYELLKGLRPVQSGLLI